ncbi:MAG: hypothetical protein ACR2NP_01780 [Pirellulaceae bacterium]
MFYIRSIVALTLAAAFLFSTAAPLNSDIYHFESFTGFPDHDQDGLEDWTLDGWVDTSHFGEIQHVGVLDDWFLAVTTPYNSFTLTSGNSFARYVDQDGPGFLVTPDNISRPTWSMDRLEFISTDDAILQVQFGNASDLLLQTRTTFGIPTNARVTRDPPNPVFASVIPEPNLVRLALPGLGVFLIRRRRRPLQ